MPQFSSAQLEQLARRILTAAGARPEEAALVAEELAASNLVGHDSHGVIRLKQYVDHIAKGEIVPGGEIRMPVDLPAVAVLDGGSNFGQVVAHRALALAEERARAQGAFTVFCRDCNHVGRLGAYTHAAARKGMCALMAVNTPAKGAGVAPFGAAERRMGTNPISLAAPWQDDAIVLDMTTSATAEGKVRVALQEGKPVPEGWILDHTGSPSTNPADLYGPPPGSILPLGGPLGFKGYGLGAMLDLFCGALSDAGVARPDRAPGTNGVWLAVYNVEAILGADAFQRWVEHYVTWIKSARRQPGVEEILMPGEIERRRAEARRRGGVDLPEATWRQTLELAEQLGVDLQDLT